MTIETDPFQSMGDILGSALGNLLFPPATRLIDMVSEEIVFEFPYAPHDGVKRIDGKQPLAKYLKSVSDILAIDTMTLEKVYACVDSEVVILEFSAKGHRKSTGASYDQNYISVITVRHGRIVHYRDYWNPMALTDAIGAEAEPTEEPPVNDVEE
jgi:uncharacterized protein